MDSSIPRLSSQAQPARSTRAVARPNLAVEQNGRGRHLRKFATQASRIGKKKVPCKRLTPREYERRQPHKDAAAVVLLFAHNGVVRPSAWQALLLQGNAALLIYSTMELPSDLQPCRFPMDFVTAWEDITIFEVLLAMLKYALNAYKKATVFYTASGDSIPLVDTHLLADPWSELGIPQGTPVTGITVKNQKPSMPLFEAARQAALSKAELPPMPSRCYGSQWVMLNREHASMVVASGTQNWEKLKGIYNETLAQPQDGHTKLHARFHPDEEYIPYILHVLHEVPWPTEDREIMAEEFTSEPLCALCKYRAGHASILDERSELQLKDKLERQQKVRLFMRKVQ